MNKTDVPVIGDEITDKIEESADADIWAKSEIIVPNIDDELDSSDNLQDHSSAATGSSIIEPLKPPSSETTDDSLASPDKTQDNSSSANDSSIVDTSIPQPTEEVMVGSTTDYYWYTDVKEMMRRADVVIIGKVASTYTKDLDVGSGLVLPYTISSIEVTKVVIGKVVNGETIEVKQLGNVVNPVASADYLRIGQDYLLFLKTYDNLPCSTLNPIQGQYPVDKAGNITAHPDNTIEFPINNISNIDQLIIE